MKKVFYQNHIGFYIMTLLFFSLISVGIYVVVHGIILLEVPAVLSALMVSFLFSFIFISTAYYRVIFLEDRIHITGELGDKRTRTQFKDEIFYHDIENVRLVYVNKNSKKKSFSSPSYGNLRPRMYYEFILKNKQTKWVYISFFSKKTKNAMLAIINEKTGLNVSYEQMYEDLKKQFQQRKK